MSVPLLSTAQVARRIGRSSRTVLRHVRDGALPVAFVAPGAAHDSYLFHESDVDAFVRRYQPEGNLAAASTASQVEELPLESSDGAGVGEARAS